MKTDLFQSCGHWWVFQVCWHIECSTFTASSFRIWNLFNSNSFANTAASAKSLQSCLTLCDPIDGSPPDSAIPGILQARTLEWVAISFSNAGKWKVKGKSLSRVWLFTTPWAAADQAPLSVGFSRQEYWSGVPLPSPLLILRIFIFKNLLFFLKIIFLMIKHCSIYSLYENIV